MAECEARETQPTEEEQEFALPPEIEEKRRKGQLRTGYTTGSCAAVASKGATLALIAQSPLDHVTIELPIGREATFKMERCVLGDGWAECSTIKDAGDDPDVTHGAEICSTVYWTERPGIIEVEGGKGVGLVTKPGLGLEIGRPAINPVPMKMIVEAAREAAGSHLSEKGLRVVISVPGGEEMAKKTDNPRLGIIGGISILGTKGIVIPYSTRAFTASIEQGLDVVKALGSYEVALSTGGRSDEFAQKLLKLPEHAFIQMGDFVGFTLRRCVERGMRKAIICGFIGKLSKMAMGRWQTHARGSSVDMGFLARVAAKCGAPVEVQEEIRGANTARHVSEIVIRHELIGYFDRLCQHICQNLSAYAGGPLSIECIMFEFDGSVLGRYPPLDGVASGSS